MAALYPEKKNHITKNRVRGRPLYSYHLCIFWYLVSQLFNWFKYFQVSTKPRLDVWKRITVFWITWHPAVQNLSRQKLIKIGQDQKVSWFGWVHKDNGHPIFAVKNGDGNLQNKKWLPLTGLRDNPTIIIRHGVQILRNILIK